MPTRLGSEYPLTGLLQETSSIEMVQNPNQRWNVGQGLDVNQIEEQVSDAIPLIHSSSLQKHELLDGSTEQYDCTARVSLSLNGPKISVCFDSGAMFSMIPEDVLRTYAPQAIIEPLEVPVDFRAVGGNAVHATDFAMLDFYFDGTLAGSPAMALIRTEIYVVSGHSTDDFLIGVDCMKLHKFVLDLCNDEAIVGACRGIKIPINAKPKALMPGPPQLDYATTSDQCFSHGEMESGSTSIKKQETVIQHLQLNFSQEPPSPIPAIRRPKILFQENLGYILYTLPSRRLFKQETDALATVLEVGDQEFELLITSREKRWLQMSLRADTSPVFEYEHLLFYYLAPEEDEPNSHWLLSFLDFQSLDRFQDVFIRAGLYKNPEPALSEAARQEPIEGEPEAVHARPELVHDMPSPLRLDDADQELWLVEEIRDSRRFAKRFQYKLKYCDFEEPSWQPLASLIAGGSTAVLMDRFHYRFPHKKRPTAADMAHAKRAIR